MHALWNEFSSRDLLTAHPSGVLLLRHVSVGTGLWACGWNRGQLEIQSCCPENGVSRWRPPNWDIYSQNDHFGLVYNMMYQFLDMEAKNYKFGMFCQLYHPSVVPGDSRSQTSGHHLWATYQLSPLCMVAFQRVGGCSGWLDLNSDCRLDIFQITLSKKRVVIKFQNWNMMILMLSQRRYVLAEIFVIVRRFSQKLQAHKLNMIKREKLARHPRTIWRIWACDDTTTSRMPIFNREMPPGFTPTICLCLNFVYISSVENRVD